MKLTQEQARGLVWSEAWPELGLEVVLNEQTGSRRWVSVHQLVVKDADGRFWATTYECGLTEYQDTSPFEDETEVEFHQVEKVRLEAYEYRPLKTIDLVTPGQAEPVGTVTG